MTPVFPMVHGTTEGIAWKIAQSGFGTTGTRDAGYYGAGIYFTSHVSYARQYSNKGSKQKVVIIALVNPGNFYPTTEDPEDRENGFMGKKCKGGYQSHYTVVGDGIYPSTTVTDTSHDELVVFQDPQALPKYRVILQAPLPTGVSLPTDATLPIDVMPDHKLPDREPPPEPKRAKLETDGGDS